MNIHFSNCQKSGCKPAVVDFDDLGDFYIYEKVLETQGGGEAGNPEELVLNQIVVYMLLICPIDADQQQQLSPSPTDMRLPRAAVPAVLCGTGFRDASPYRWS